MKIINKPRGTGKTYRLIITADVTGVPILVKTTSQKQYIKEQAKRMNCEVRVHTIDEFMKQRLKYREVLIDELELIIGEALEEYLGTEVIAGTMSVDMIN